MEVNKWHYTFGLMQKLKSTLEPADFSRAEFQEDEEAGRSPRLQSWEVQMFNLNEYSKFLEAYKENLVGSNDLNEELKVNYRVQKLMLFYPLKDKTTFSTYLKNDECFKLMGTTKYILENVENYPTYNSKEMRNLAKFLLNEYFTNVKIPNSRDDALVEGGYKLLADFIGQKKFQKLKEKHNNVHFNIDSLEFV